MKKWGILLVLSITVLPSFAQLTYGNSLASPLQLSLQQDTTNPGSYYVLRPQHLLPSPYTAQQSQIISAVLNSDRAPLPEVTSNNAVSGNTLQLSPVSVGRIKSTQNSPVPLNQPLNVVKYTLVRSSSTVSGGYQSPPIQEITEDQDQAEADVPEAEEQDVKDLNSNDEAAADEEINDGPTNAWDDEDEVEDEDENQAEAPVSRPAKPTRQRSSPKKETARSRPSSSSRRSKKRPVQIHEEEEDEDEADEAEDENVEEEEEEEVAPAPRPKSQARRRNKSKHNNGWAHSSNKNRASKSRPSSREEINERISPKLKSGASRSRTSSAARKQPTRSQNVPRKSKQNGRAKKPEPVRVQNEVPKKATPTESNKQRQGVISISPATVESIAPGDNIGGATLGGANLQLATISPESQNQVLSNLITTLQRTTPITSISTNGAISSQQPYPAAVSPAQPSTLPNGLSSLQQMPQQSYGIQQAQSQSGLGNQQSPQQQVSSNQQSSQNGLGNQQSQGQQQTQGNARQTLQGSPNVLSNANPVGGQSSSPSVQASPEYRVVPALSYEIANGNFVVSSDDEPIGNVQSSQQASQNQIRSQYQQNSIQQSQYGPPIQNQGGQQIDNNSQLGGQISNQGPQFGGQISNQGPQFGGQISNQGGNDNMPSVPSVQYGVVPSIHQDESSLGQWGQPLGQGIPGNPSNNQPSSQYGDNGITNQGPAQSNNDYPNQYDPADSPVATMTVRFSENSNDVSNPLLGVENVGGFSMSQPSEEGESGNNAIPQNTLREAINLVALFAQSQVNGQDVVSSQDGSTQFSVSPSQVFIPSPEAAEEIFRDPVPNIRNIQMTTSNGNSGGGEADEDAQDSQNGVDNQFQQQNYGAPQSSSQNGLGNQQSLQQQGYNNHQSSQEELGNQQGFQQQGYSSQQSLQNGGNQQPLQQQGYTNQRSSQNGLGNQQSQGQQQGYSNQRSSQSQSQNDLGNQQSQGQQQGYSNQRSSQSQNDLGNQQSQGQQQGYSNQRSSQSQNDLGNQQSQGQQQGYSNQRSSQSQNDLGNQQSQGQQQGYSNQRSSQNSLGNQQSNSRSQQRTQSQAARSQQSQIKQIVYRNQQPQGGSRSLQQSSQSSGQPSYGAPISTDSDSDIPTKVTGVSLAYPKSNGNQQSIGATAGTGTRTIFRTISNLLTRSYGQ